MSDVLDPQQIVEADARLEYWRGRDFLSLADVPKPAAEALLELAAAYKADRRAGRPHPHLAGKSLALILRKPSTRTRVSFEVAMCELGGQTIVMGPQDSQIGRGEDIKDTGRVLSRYVHVIAIRTFAESELEALAEAASAPVINALTDDSHPCQALADVMTMREHLGSLSGRRVAYVGDGNNMLHSLLQAARLFDFEISVATPAGYAPRPEWLAAAGGWATAGTDPQAAVRGADVIYTDTWTSMGQEEESERRREAFRGFQVDARLLSLAKPDAKVMHCLPAHRGEEVTSEVLDGPASIVFDQAENRLHAQKALLAALLHGSS